MISGLGAGIHGDFLKSMRRKENKRLDPF